MAIHENGAVDSSNGSVLATLPPLLARVPFTGVAIDSRDIQPGNLFVALPGERVDGHQFVADALARGAAAALVRRDWAATTAARGLPALTAHDLPAGAASTPTLLAVEDPLQTLQALAAHRRAQFDLAVIGITGSVGKTSTKELVAAVLRRRFPTLASAKSFNNEIGLPLTLMGLRSEHRAAVLEMGTYGPGDIALLCAIARPGIGIVLNIGASHLERMGTLETVAQAKGELIEALPPDGLAILNGDDERARAMRGRTTARTILFGLDPRVDLHATEIDPRGLDGIGFTLRAEGRQRRFELPLLGRHTVYNALAAIAVGRELGLEWPEIEAGLADRRAQARLILKPGIYGTTLLDDSYNASPASCQAALDVLAAAPGRRVAVFGDMAELGPEEIAGHRAVGRAAAAVVDLLVVVGQKARYIGEAALEAARPPDVRFAATNAAATTLLKARIAPGDYILVKGARVAATEEIVAGLSEAPRPSDAGHRSEEDDA